MRKAVCLGQFYVLQNSLYALELCVWLLKDLCSAVPSPSVVKPVFVLMVSISVNEDIIYMILPILPPVTKIKKYKFEKVSYR